MILYYSKLFSHKKKTISKNMGSVITTSSTVIGPNSYSWHSSSCNSGSISLAWAQLSHLKLLTARNMGPAITIIAGMALCQL